jgi:predicted porin
MQASCARRYVRAHRQKTEEWKRMSRWYARLLVSSTLLVCSLPPLSAADLSANCCADLEERIAELEETAARTGQRNVKLTVSGFLNEAIMFWDDGFEQNADIVTNDNGRGRIAFRGVGKINDEWSAGFRLEIGIRIENSKRFSQDDPGIGGLDVRHSLWFIESKKYGRLTVGDTGGAGEGSTEMNLSKTFDVAKYSDPEDVALGLFLRRTDGSIVRTTSGAGFAWYRLIRDYGDQAGEGRRSNMVRYDTPEIAGFIGIVNWGQDDAWEIGTRYRAENNGFRVAAAITYGENTELRPSGGSYAFACLGQIPGAPTDSSCNQLGMSASLMHDPTGLYTNVAYGQSIDNLIDETSRFRGVDGAEDKTWFWAMEAGIQRKFVPIGTTTLFGQYYYDEGGSNAIRNIRENGRPARILDTGYSYIGGGVVQMVDQAALELYLYYRHSTAEMTLLPGTSGNATPIDLDLEDLDVVTAGALIRF